MKLTNRIKFAGLITLIIAATACSTPIYKQNKYKNARRNRNCGCHTSLQKADKMLSFNDTK